MYLDWAFSYKQDSNKQAYDSLSVKDAVSYVHKQYTDDKVNMMDVIGYRTCELSHTLAAANDPTNPGANAATVAMDSALLQAFTALARAAIDGEMPATMAAAASGAGYLAVEGSPYTYVFQDGRPVDDVWLTLTNTGPVKITVTLPPPSPHVKVISPYHWFYNTEDIPAGGSLPVEFELGKPDGADLAQESITFRAADDSAIKGVFVFDLFPQDIMPKAAIGCGRLNANGGIDVFDDTGNAEVKQPAADWTPIPAGTSPKLVYHEWAYQSNGNGEADLALSTDCQGLMATQTDAAAQMVLDTRVHAFSGNHPESGHNPGGVSGSNPHWQINLRLPGASASSIHWSVTVAMDQAYTSGGDHAPGTLTCPMTMDGGIYPQVAANSFSLPPGVHVLDLNCDNAEKFQVGARGEHNADRWADSRLTLGIKASRINGAAAHVSTQKFVVP
jgi:hypothetical protein